MLRWRRFTIDLRMPLNVFPPNRLQARRQFYARLEMLYERESQGVAYEEFRFEVVKRCKEYLRKN